MAGRGRQDAIEMLKDGNDVALQEIAEEAAKGAEYVRHSCFSKVMTRMFHVLEMIYVGQNGNGNGKKKFSLLRGLITFEGFDGNSIVRIVGALALIYLVLAHSGVIPNKENDVDTNTSVARLHQAVR